ncbi:MAG: hypothetical protein K6G49_02145 [Candidatus Saccharibacteria bacterium]|nr:hypothetical protein [Candidatus Saccharibacteria bacterium]
MSGTKIGGIKARNTIYKEHGLDYYERIGKLGGQKGHTGGFASNPEAARIAGRKGGSKSRRSIAKNERWLEVRDKVMLGYKNGCSIREMAEYLKIPESTLYYRVRKEREMAEEKEAKKALKENDKQEQKFFAKLFGKRESING